MPVADFTLQLRRLTTKRYEAEALWSLPDDEALPAPVRKPIRIDFGELRLLLGNWRAYGRKLRDDLFTPGGKPSRLGHHFQVALTWLRGQDADSAIRFRLCVDEGSPELHSVWWETLWNLPAEDTWLFSNPRIWFSRFLANRAHYPVRRRRKGPLRAILAVGTPPHKQLEQFNLAPILPQSELQSVKRTLGSQTGEVRCEVELYNAADRPVTTSGLAECLQGRYDVFCLTCHGAVAKGVSALWLEEQNAKGEWQLTRGSDVVDVIRNLPEKPRLVVLKSCYSGAGGVVPTTDLFGAIGPALAFAGVPAVLALQGRTPIETADAFAETFYSVLREHGVIDRAMAKARSLISNLEDPWMPVLFSRLRSGQLWYEPGIVDGEEFENWETILTHLRKGECTPILGPGLLDDVVGDMRDIARRLANDLHCPLPESTKSDLPAVAHCIATRLGEATLRDRLTQEMSEAVWRHTPNLPLPAQGGGNLSELLSAAGLIARVQRDDPHRVLADLQLKLYITTNPDRLMADALVAPNRWPEESLCCWTDDKEVVWPPAQELATEPTPDRPHVFYLYGRWDYPDTVVLTETNHFDFLTAVAESRDELISDTIRGALSNSALMFLGFRLDDWAFRVPFHGLLGRSRGRRRKYTHVAVQVEPDEGRWSDTRRARRLLEKYFYEAKILIYWGSATDFLMQLRDKLAQNPR